MHQQKIYRSKMEASFIKEKLKILKLLLLLKIKKTWGKVNLKDFQNVLICKDESWTAEHCPFVSFSIFE